MKEMILCSSLDHNKQPFTVWLISTSWIASTRLPLSLSASWLEPVAFFSIWNRKWQHVGQSRGTKMFLKCTFISSLQTDQGFKTTFGVTAITYRIVHTLGIAYWCPAVFMSSILQDKLRKLMTSSISTDEYHIDWEK